MAERYGYPVDLLEEVHEHVEAGHLTHTQALGMLVMWAEIMDLPEPGETDTAYLEDIWYEIKYPHLNEIVDDPTDDF